jgi:hypothetical protein
MNENFDERVLDFGVLTLRPGLLARVTIPLDDSQKRLIWFRLAGFTAAKM